MRVVGTIPTRVFKEGQGKNRLGVCKSTWRPSHELVHHVSLLPVRPRCEFSAIILEFHACEGITAKVLSAPFDDLWCLEQGLSLPHNI